MHLLLRGVLASALSMLAMGGAAEAKEPICVARMRTHVPGAAMTTTIKAGAMGRQRLLFRRGDVVLVIDYAVLDANLRAFVKEQGAERAPEEVDLLRRLHMAFGGGDEVAGDRLVRTPREQARLDRRLAEVLDRGAFALRPGKPASGSGALGRTPASEIIRLDYSYNCGERCGTSGRIFLTRSCQELVAVTDWVG
jgi:hypothetical protein